MERTLNKRYVFAAMFLSLLFVWEQNRLNVFGVIRPSALCINVILFGAVSYMGYRFLADFQKNKYVCLLSFFMAIVLCLGILFRMVPEVQTGQYLRTLLSAVCLTPSIAFGLFEGLEWLSHIRKSESTGRISKKKYFFCCFGIIFLCWLPCFLAYFPGIPAYDIGYQIGQFLSGDYSTHHPLFHTFLIGIFYAFGLNIGSIQTGVVLYSLFQSAVLALTMAYSLTFLREKKINRYLRLILLIYYAFFPIHPVLAISFAKDVLFAAFFLLFCLFWIEFMGREEILKKDCIKIVLAGILVFLFRNNARYALLIWGVVWGIALWRKRQKKYKVGLVLLLLVLGLGKLFEFSAIQITHAEKGSVKEMLSVPIVQMGRCLYYNNSEMDDDILQEFDTLKYEADLYNPVLADQQKWFLCYEGNEKTFWKLYFEMLKRYPVTCISAFLYLQQGAWSLDDISIGNIGMPTLEDRIGYLATYTISGYGIEHHSLLPGVEMIYEKLFSINGYQDLSVLSILFLPMFYVFLLLLSLVNGALKKNIPLTGGIILLYYLSLLLGPCSLIRYHYPVVLASLVLFCYEFGGNQEIIRLKK